MDMRVITFNSKTYVAAAILHECVSVWEDVVKGECRIADAAISLIGIER